MGSDYLNSLKVKGADLIYSAGAVKLRNTLEKLKEAANIAELDKKNMEKAASDFEALLLDQMFKEMWKTVPKGGMLSGSREEEIYREMFSESLAKQFSKDNSLGIKELVLKDMMKFYGK